MSLDPEAHAPFDDSFLRSALAAGIIDGRQADQLIALRENRGGTIESMGRLDEPFELFRGFNEIFIVSGLLTLFAGWIGGGYYLTGFAPPWKVFFSLLPVTLALSWYFTRRRRMVAPSIALVVTFAVALISAMTGYFSAVTFTTGAVAVTLALAVHFALFRVPITTAMMAVGTLAAIVGAISSSYGQPLSPDDLATLTKQTPFALATVAVGVAAFILGMIYDLSDPHRITRRSSSAFWLHVFAAWAIVTPIVDALLVNLRAGFAAWPDPVAWVVPAGALLSFIAAMSLIALIIDRRSFLMAGVASLIYLFQEFGDSSVLLLVPLGMILLVLGAKWDSARSALMRALPEFPGKHRLPPYLKDVSS